MVSTVGRLSVRTVVLKDVTLVSTPQMVSPSGLVARYLSVTCQCHRFDSLWCQVLSWVMAVCAITDDPKIVKTQFAPKRIRH